jgi:3-(3-hydroxy-phenyl)propionate hydroxylase
MPGSTGPDRPPHLPQPSPTAMSSPRAAGYKTLPEYPFVAQGAPPEGGCAPELKLRRRHPVPTRLSSWAAASPLRADAGLRARPATACRWPATSRPCCWTRTTPSGVKGASSRGICYTQKSLEIFHRLGVYERIAAKGIQWSVGRTFAGHDEVYSFDLRQQQTGTTLSASRPSSTSSSSTSRATGRANCPGARRRRPALETASPLRAGRDRATLQLTTPAGDYRLDRRPCGRLHGSHSPFRAWWARASRRSKGDDRWCIADVRFTRTRRRWSATPGSRRRSTRPRRLAAPDGRRRLAHRLPDAAARQPEDVSREDVVRERLKASSAPTARSRSSGSAPMPTAANAWTDAARPRVLRRRRGQGDEPVRRARRQLGHRRTPTTWPGSWPPCCRAAPRPPCSTATTPSGTRRRAQRAGHQPHHALPAAGRRHAERLFRTRRWAWRASLCSPGSWSTPAACPRQHYTRSGACGHRRPSVQNVGSAGPTAAPASWWTTAAVGRRPLLLLVFGDVSAAALARLRALVRRPRRCAACRCWGR